MPPRWACIGIVLFWLVMSTLLFERDLAPRLFHEELRYSSVLADRAVEENTRWVLRSESRRIGAIATTTRPRSDGGTTLLARARLTTNLLNGTEGDAAPKITIESEFEISGGRRLTGFQCIASLDRPALTVKIIGSVVDGALEIRTTGTPLLPPLTHLAIDPQALVLNALGPIDRLPDLWIGRRWTTSVVNPLSALLPAQGILSNSMETVQHAVVAEEIASWNGRCWKCFRIEHRHDKTVSSSYVRQSDGRLLRQELPLGIVKLTIELDPAADRWETRRETAR